MGNTFLVVLLIMSFNKYSRYLIHNRANNSSPVSAILATFAL